jgi:hypothetical protein
MGSFLLSSSLKAVFGAGRGKGKLVALRSSAPLAEYSQTYKDVVAGNDGVASGDPQWKSDGPTSDIQGSLRLDGASDMVDFGVLASGLGIGGANTRTIEAWLKRYTTGRDSVYSLGDESTSLSEFSLVGGFNIGDYYVFLGPSSQHSNNFGTNADTWAHSALVYDGTDVIHYVSGAKAIARSGVTLDTKDVNTFSIGNHPTENDGDISIADLRVWNFAKTSQEITDGKDSRLKGDESGLVGYWPLGDTD